MKALLLALAFVGFVWAAPARADDATDCQAGIDMIKAELAKKPSPAAAKKLEKALKDAEREAGEKEYSECFEAIEDAKAALGGG
jgi:hypothetical protein